MNDQILFLFDLLKNGNDEIQSLKQLCDKIAFNAGVKVPFELQFKNLDGTDNNQYDIILNPGNPVIMTINDRYVLEHILGHKSHANFKYRLTQAIDRLHLMHRTLKHLIPLNTAIALKKEVKEKKKELAGKGNWDKIAAPIFEEKLIKSNQLQFSFKVTVFDPITQTGISLNGEDPIQLKKEAISRLSRMIFENEELLDLLESIEAQRNMDVNKNPTEIKLGGADGESRESITY